MKRIVSILSVSVSLVFCLPILLYAQLNPTLVNKMLGADNEGGGLSQTNLDETISREEGTDVLSDARLVVVNQIGRYMGIALSIIGTVALGYVVYGGYLWTTAAGNSDQAGEGKRILVNSVIAIVICGSSYVLISFITKGLTTALITPL
ncbi:MAG: hypothetical protein G01um101418_315 [Parcubacteria group bacterium Gr01-1014_18]|nr:MAG: hypothetical protein Greene041636_309 [Parcubacteria group bacterium Greene0416_36]TSC81175.1 MAG: hypothetical protein G01um101418_315 [Parcubacteria group bacterium Gr01-1014_18]TSC99172.1 MAG: hypothetical protein Greene101420_317 [Parcubacteria group bacterium Greene1014_20]TSD07470.1 MAG: hypothetical protein Greene07142_169 [Parcubacteria group bacterium Greene0714_2]